MNETAEQGRPFSGGEAEKGAAAISEGGNAVRQETLSGAGLYAKSHRNRIFHGRGDGNALYS